MFFRYKKNPEFETTVFFEYRDIENKYHSFTGGLIRGGWPKKQLTDAVGTNHSAGCTPRADAWSRSARASRPPPVPPCPRPQSIN